MVHPHPPSPPPITWYRSPVPREVMRTLVRRSNRRGFAQTLGHLGLLGLTAAGTLWSAAHLPWPVTGLLLFLHGTIGYFGINAVHELGHGTVFRTRALNAFFVRIFAFLSWTNFEVFNQSHARHHRYTLHPPDDLEVVMPKRMWLLNYLRRAFIDPAAIWQVWHKAFRLAIGQFDDPWEAEVCPPGSSERRRAVRWARLHLAGHLTLIGIGALTGNWLIPVLTTFLPGYGAWLFLSCNETQHIGLGEHLTDFRQCCRTFTANPVIEFLYWHMNYHIEHHMFAAVPCYHLAKLHRQIHADLPPCPHGIVNTWREIDGILQRQKIEPDYFYLPALPGAK